MTVLLLVLVGAGAFFGGMKYQESKQPAFLRQFNGQVGARITPGQFLQGRLGGQAVNGEIVESDETSITIKLADGSSKIVFLSDTTTISQLTQVAKTDLKTGDKVTVFGAQNSDGSLTAQRVEINPNLVPTPGESS